MPCPPLGSHHFEHANRVLDKTGRKVGTWRKPIARMTRKGRQLQVGGHQPGQ